MNPYDNVAEFERRVAEYAGAPYGVAVNSCTSAIMLSVAYRFMERRIRNREVWLPKHTYVGVAQAVIMAGGRCRFYDIDWSGAYDLCESHIVNVTLSTDHWPTHMEKLWHVGIIDSARRFRRGMYVPGTLYNLSFHWHKHLPVGRGGMILTDDWQAAETLRKMRYDGRTQGVAPANDTFDTPGWHVYMIPEDAARGLMLLGRVADDNDDLPWDDYGDLSQHKLFQEGWR